MVKLTSAIKFSIHNRTFFRHFLLFVIPKKIRNASFQRVKRKLYFNYRINYHNPHSFSEYLQWILKYYRNDLWKECADKLKCKQFLSARGFEPYLPKTLAIYSNSSEIDLDKLPNKFVLKTNNDSGSVFICEKGKTDFSEVFKKLDASISKNYSNLFYEWFYEDIRGQIFAEEYLKPLGSNELADFKFFVFNGRFRFGFVAQNRRKDVRFTLFEDSFKFVPCEYGHLKPKKKDIFEKPENFDVMVKLVEDVGKNFDFVRVDLYNTTKGIKIGELTFASMSGFGAFTKKEYDFKYGKYFDETIFNGLARKSQK